MQEPGCGATCKVQEAGWGARHSLNSAGSGFLTDELDGPTTPFVIPALGFGVSVDSREGVYQPCSIFGCIAKKYQFRQAGTVIKHAVPDNLNSRRNGNATQASTVDEGIIPDTGDAVRYCDARQAVAPMEGFLPDGGRTVTNRDASQVSAFIERGNTDGDDAIRDVVIGSLFPSRVSNQ